MAADDKLRVHNGLPAEQEKQGLSGMDLMRLTGIAPAHISRINGSDDVSTMSLRTAHRLAKALGTTVDKLFPAA